MAAWQAITVKPVIHDIKQYTGCVIIQFFPVIVNENSIKLVIYFEQLFIDIDKI